MMAYSPLVVLLATFLGCGPEQGSPTREAESASGEMPALALPPPNLSPKLPELERLAEAAPAVPDEEAALELAELVELTFGGADEWLAKRARRTLFRSEQLDFALEAGLQHPLPAVRSACAYELGERGMGVAIPRLLWRMRYEFDAEVRLWLVDALVRLGNHSQLDVLRQLLDDPVVAERAAATTDRVLDGAGLVLEERTWEAMKNALGTAHGHWRRVGRTLSAEDLGVDPFEAVDGAALRGRLAGLLAGLTEFQLRPVDEARAALTNMGVLPLDLLRLGCLAEERYLRVHTVEIVRDLGRPAAPLGEVVLPLLGVADTAMTAIEALGEIGHLPALPHLLALLEGEDPEGSTAAAGALGPLGDPSAVEPLRVHLRDEGEWIDVRVRAAFSLALLEQGGEGLEFLLERERVGDYHLPTVSELLERVRAATSRGP